MTLAKHAIMFMGIVIAHISDAMMFIGDIIINKLMTILHIFISYHLQHATQLCLWHIS